jgi:hypothetical protein
VHFLDVAGPPGSGKSTLADPIWGPHDLPIEDRLPPVTWAPFVDEITRLFHLIAPHPTIDAARRMNNRSIRKMATVVRNPSNRTYVQTGLVQRGLGFGWRMRDLGLDMNELRPFFYLMPVSIGVVMTKCPRHIVEQRNHDRRLVRETRHEDRARMVGLMVPAIDIAMDVLARRNVPIMEIDTTQPIETARCELVTFARRGPWHGAQDHDSTYEVLTPPWWER